MRSKVLCSCCQIFDCSIMSFLIRKAFAWVLSRFSSTRFKRNPSLSTAYNVALGACSKIAQLLPPGAAQASNIVSVFLGLVKRLQAVMTRLVR